MSKPIKKRPFDQCQCPNCCRERAQLRRPARKFRESPEVRAMRLDAKKRVNENLNALADAVGETLRFWERFEEASLKRMSGELNRLRLKFQAAGRAAKGRRV
jgi:hypothetical protein